MAHPDFRSIVTDSIRYWETSRLYYNLWLSGVVVGSFLCLQLPTAMLASAAFWVPLLIMAAAANLLFCSAYPVDILIQLSDFRDSWRSHRWLLLALGCVLAGILAFCTLPILTIGGRSWP